MVTSYYMMHMSKNTKGVRVEDYYRDLCRQNSLKNIDSSSCRVCLKGGDLALRDTDIKNDLIEALRIFGDIDINTEDEFPKYLCYVCYKFVKQAILFRKVAKSSSALLQSQFSSVKEETCEQFNHTNDSDGEQYVSVSNGSWSEIEEEYVEVEHRKKEKKISMAKFEAKVTCQICNKVVNESYYKQHFTMHDPDHHKYVCDVCGKSFRLRCAYYNHSRRHREDFQFKCQFCPYKARYSELLKGHLRTHTGDYRYMCTECPARFLYKSNLNRHMFKHKEPEFKCDACKRAFHTKSARQKHFEADHLGIKNHVCGICGKVFGYRNAMMKHERGVHKRQKMMCGRMPSYLKAEIKT